MEGRSSPMYVSSLVVNFGPNNNAKNNDNGHRKPSEPSNPSDIKNEQSCFKVNKTLESAITHSRQHEYRSVEFQAADLKKVRNSSGPLYKACITDGEGKLLEQDSSISSGNLAQNFDVSAFHSQEKFVDSSGEVKHQGLMQNEIESDACSVQKNYTQIYNNIRRQQLSEKTSSVMQEESHSSSIYEKEKCLSIGGSMMKTECDKMNKNPGEISKQCGKVKGEEPEETFASLSTCDVKQVKRASAEVKDVSSSMLLANKTASSIVERKQTAFRESSQNTEHTEYFAQHSNSIERIGGSRLQCDTISYRNFSESADCHQLHETDDKQLNKDNSISIMHQSSLFQSDKSTTESHAETAVGQCESTSFIYPAPQSANNICNESSIDENHAEPPRVISIFKGHVKLKSKAFQSNKSTNQSKSCANLSSDLDGIVNESVTALQAHTAEDRHESQIVGSDANQVDGHVRVKQTLFETLPVDALYEHGLTHSSQIVTRGRRKSNLGEVLNEFNTKALAEINERESNPPEKDVVEFDVCSAVTSFKTLQDHSHEVRKEELHESQRVDEDIPFDNNLVKENAERFLCEDFCYKTQYESSQNVTEEEKIAACGLFHSMKGEFENKPLDFIGLEDRPGRHPSQFIEDEHMRKSEDENGCEDFVLSEPHSSQQISYHEEMLNGLTQVREKRRQYYEYCNSPSRCMSRELIEDSEVLNSPELSGMVKQTAAVYLNESSDWHRPMKKYSNDIYVKPLKNKFETQTISQLSMRGDLHSSQCTDDPDHLSEETQKQHCLDFNECLALHTSQVIDPAEYAGIKSDVGVKKYAFSNMAVSSSTSHGNQHSQIEFETQVKPIKKAFEACQTQNSPALHPSQIVGHDIHLISSSDVEESHSRVEKSELHESQKVNFGIVRPTTRNREREESLDRPCSSDFVRTSCINQPAPSRTPVKSSKSLEKDDEDLELLLNYKPVVKQELPSMVTVMVKGVPSELIESGHPILTEYVTSSTPRKRISVGSRTSTPVRNTSINSCPDARMEKFPPPVAQRRCITKESDAECLGSTLQKSDFVSEPVNLTPPCNDSPSLPSYPGSTSPGDSCDFVEEPLPPPPVFENMDDDVETRDSCSLAETSPHPDFVVGSTISNPSKCNNIITTPDAEMSFWTAEQENTLRGRFAKYSNRQITSSTESCNAFLRVIDDEFHRRISAATVESYPESDDQWDFVA